MVYLYKIALIFQKRFFMKKDYTATRWFGFIAQGVLAFSMLLSLGFHAHAEEATMKVVPFESLKFSKKEAGNPQIAPVRGNPEKEASSIIMKLGRGAFPMHSHSSDYELVVIKGTMKHWGVNQTQAQAVAMKPGSYWYQPAKEVHGDACESEQCVWFITFKGPRDFEAAEQKKK